MEYIYIFRSYSKDGTLLKFGFTGDIWARLAQYKSTNPGIEIVYIAQLENAYELEQTFHNKTYAVSGNEWYEESLLPTMLEYLEGIEHINYTNNKKEAVEKEFFKDIIIKCKLGEVKDYNKLCKKYPFLHDAIQHLGYDKIEELNYHLHNIKKAVSRIVNTDQVSKIKDVLKTKSKISKGHFISNKELKMIFEEIYTELNIEKTAKSLDIKNYYSVKAAQKPIFNKETNRKEKENGVIIL